MMPKRMTDTEKWQDDWFVGLSPDHKLFWLYLCDRCDHAGIWKVSTTIPERMIGIKLNLAAALDAFGDRVEILKEGYWRLTRFLAFQYKIPMNPSNKTHESALKLLASFNIDTSPFQAPSKPLPSPFEGAKDKDKDITIKELDSLSIKIKDNSISNDSKKDKVEFTMFWDIYPKRVAKQDAIRAWSKLTPQEQETALKVIPRHKDTPDWKKEDGKFIPYPATWLNGRRWEDQIDQIKKPVDAQTNAVLKDFMRREGLGKQR
jgi:hypothetical protein